MTVGDVVRRMRQEHLGKLVVHDYQEGLVRRPLAKLLEHLKLIVQKGQKSLHNTSVLS